MSVKQETQGRGRGKKEELTGQNFAVFFGVDKQSGEWLRQETKEYCTSQKDKCAPQTLQMLELFPWLRFFGPQVWKDLDQLRIRYRKFYLALTKQSKVRFSHREKISSHVHLLHS